MTLISIILISYNQEKYIGEAIEGIVKQTVNWRLQIVIGDDGSTDRTPEVIKEYYSRFPEVIVPIIRERNIGANQNFIDCYRRCDGKYIALCEGDDYWSDHDKLQKQADFLENNPAYTICFTNTEYLNELTGEKRQVITSNSRIRNFYDLVKNNFIATQTVMYRNLKLPLPSGFEKLKVGDWPLHVLHAQYGKIGHLNEYTAVYRIHDANTWSGTDSAKKIGHMARAAIFLANTVQPKYRNAVRRQALRYIHYLVDRQIREKDYPAVKDSSTLIDQLPGWWMSWKAYYIFFKASYLRYSKAR